MKKLIILLIASFFLKLNCDKNTENSEFFKKFINPYYEKYKKENKNNHCIIESNKTLNLSKEEENPSLNIILDEKNNEYEESKINQYTENEKILKNKKEFYKYIEEKYPQLEKTTNSEENEFEELKVKNKNQISQLTNTKEINTIKTNIDNYQREYNAIIKDYYDNYGFYGHNIYCNYVDQHKYQPEYDNMVDFCDNDNVLRIKKSLYNNKKKLNEEIKKSNNVSYIEKSLRDVAHDQNAWKRIKEYLDNKVFALSIIDHEYYKSYDYNFDYFANLIKEFLPQ